MNIVGQNQGINRASLHSEVLGGPHSTPLPAAGGCWYPLACGHITLIFAFAVM